MKLFYIFLIFFLFLDKSFSQNIFDTDYTNINLETSNIDQAKNDSIELLKKKNLLIIMNRFLNIENMSKFKRLSKNDNLSNNLIQNIIIENEIITNDKYIADIKINYDRIKTINLLRNSRINYSDIFSEPYLILLSYSDNLNNIGLQYENAFYKNLDKNNFDSFLFKYHIPELTPNDRYLLPFNKMILEDKNAFSNIIKKYKLKEAIYVKIDKKKLGIYDITIKVFNSDTKTFSQIFIFNLDKISTINNEEFYKSISIKILSYLDNWWKSEVLIDNNIFSEIECNVLTENFYELQQIKNHIQNLNQIFSINTKKIEFNKNIEIIKFYGDIKMLSKNLYKNNIFLDYSNECKISIN